VRVVRVVRVVTILPPVLCLSTPDRLSACNKWVDATFYWVVIESL